MQQGLSDALAVDGEQVADVMLTPGVPHATRARGPHNRVPWAVPSQRLLLTSVLWPVLWLQAMHVR